MKRITTLHVEGETFEIIKHDSGYYCAINHKYLDDKGCLKVTLNGLDTMASETKSECIERATNKVRITHLMDAGLSFEDAFNKVYGLQEV